jgi:hypothetical protein
MTLEGITRHEVEKEKSPGLCRSPRAGSSGISADVEMINVATPLT